MTGSETPVSLAEKPRLAAMVRAYVAEMAAFDPGADPQAPYTYLDLYWSEPDVRFPFWLKVGGREAGFALVRRDAEAGRTQIAEFYVAPAFRRSGFGKAAARRLIARFPGRWQIAQLTGNAPAIAFWHRVLDGFVAYDEPEKHPDKPQRQQLFRYP